jgi:hypothetical protein
MRHAGRHTLKAHGSAISAAADRPGAGAFPARPGPAAAGAAAIGAGDGATRSTTRAASARSSWGASLRRRLLGIPLEEASVARRGFAVRDPRVGERLEAIGATFIGGYHAALESRDERDLGARLEETDAERRGFAFEGAAMALLLLDALTPWARGRWRRFANGPGARHIYMVHVGAGWALARLPGGFRRSWLPFDPLLSWLAYDGYGFHEGYFHRERRVLEHAVPAPLEGYALRAFDQGLGRSLWFGEGADPDRIAAAISAFSPERRADLWSGAGLAAAYAGGVEGAALESLRRLAGAFAPHVAQGAAFAAKARERAGNPAPHTALACGTLCGIEAGEAARVTDDALDALPSDGATPAFEIWRARVRERLARAADDGRTRPAARDGAGESVSARGARD